MNRLKKILVVDDERPIRELLERVLVKEGYEVLTASNGNQAFEMIKEVSPDLVLMDIRMPGPDGVVMLEKIKSAYPKIEVVMITGFGTKELALRAMKNGALDFMSKPFNISRVREIVKKCFELHELDDELAQLRSKLDTKKVRPIDEKSS